MKHYLIVGGIFTQDIEHRKIIMTLQSNDINEAVNRIDGLIKFVTRKQDYKIQVTNTNKNARLILSLSDKGKSYIEVKEIID